MKLPFARLLGVWFIAFVAISAALTMFPLSLIQNFGVSVRLPATTYAFPATVSLLLYPLAAAAAKEQALRRARPAFAAERRVRGGIDARHRDLDTAHCHPGNRQGGGDQTRRDAERQRVAAADEAGEQ